MGIGLDFMALLLRVVKGALHLSTDDDPSAGYEYRDLDDPSKKTVRVVDVMTHILRHATGDKITMEAFAVEMMWINEVAKPMLDARPDGTRRNTAIFLTLDNQARVETTVPSNAAEQAARHRRRDTDPYPEGTHFNRDGVVLPGTTEGVPWCVKRFFATRACRYGVFCVMLEYWKEKRDRSLLQ